MNRVYLFLVVFGTSLSWGQAEYFSPENKKQGLSYFKKLLYQGCIKTKAKLDMVPAEVMKDLGEKTIMKVSGSFSKALSENPKIKDAFEKEIRNIINDRYCQRENNDCRVRLFSVALFYYHRLRADLSECRAADKKTALCELETKYWRSSFQGVNDTSYKVSPIGTYRKLVLRHKNDTTLDLFKLLIQKDQDNLHLCDSSRKTPEGRFHLELDEPGVYFSGVDPDYDIRKEIAVQCENKKNLLHGDFYVLDLNKDQKIALSVSEVKSQIKKFILVRSEFVVTDVLITSTASRLPSFKTVNGKDVIDPESDKKSLTLATERAQILEKAFDDLKSSQDYKNIRYIFKAALAGPTYHPMDNNYRYVTRMNPGYLQKVQALFQKFSNLYENQALKGSYQDLIDEKEFANLFEVKFKPFQGLRIQYFGHKKNELNCLTNFSKK